MARKSAIDVMNEYADLQGVLFEGKSGNKTIRLEDLAVTMGEMPEHGRRFRVECINEGGGTWGHNHETLADAIQEVADTVAFNLRSSAVQSAW